MQQQSDNLTLYTIGHSNVSADTIIGLLRKHEIKVVIDVRSMPYSQYTAQFNREALEQVLHLAGIKYKFAGEYLGGRPKDPACYKQGIVPEGNANYLELVDYPKVAKQAWYLRGIKRLIDIAQADRTAIMCSEENPEHCHRHHLITQTLLGQGMRVFHIRKDGSVEEGTKLVVQLELDWAQERAE